MSKNVCVVYSDIVGWSKQNVAEQVSSAIELFTHLTQRIATQGLTVLWKASTGDGFAVAFPRDEGVRVVTLCRDLLDQYVRLKQPQLRLGLAEGSVDSFANPLTGSTDYTGHAVIKARRILDGITYGNTLLVQKDLAQDLKKSLPNSLVPYIVPRSPITDKHGDMHEVVQILPSQLDKQRGGRKVPPSLQQLFKASKSPEVRRTEAAFGNALFATDGVIILWMDDENRGLEAAAIQVEPDLVGVRAPASIDLPALFVERAAPYIEETKQKYGPPNNPKLWLRDDV